MFQRDNKDKKDSKFTPPASIVKQITAYTDEIHRIISDTDESPEKLLITYQKFGNFLFKNFANTPEMMEDIIKWGKKNIKIKYDVNSDAFIRQRALNETIAGYSLHCSDRYELGFTDEVVANQALTIAPTFAAINLFENCLDEKIEITEAMHGKINKTAGEWSKDLNQRLDNVMDSIAKKREKNPKKLLRFPPDTIIKLEENKFLTKETKELYGKINTIAKENRELKTPKMLLLKRIERKINDLKREGKQKQKLLSLMQVYVKLHRTDLTDQASSNACMKDVKARLKDFETFSSSFGKAGAWIKQSIFGSKSSHTTSGTRMLAGDVLDFLEKNTLTSDKLREVKHSQP